MQTTALNTTISKAFRIISSLFNLAIIDQNEVRGSMYGLTTQGHHVAMLLKVEGDKIALAVKASEMVLSTNLINEVKKLFN